MRVLITDMIRRISDGTIVKTNHPTDGELVFRPSEARFPRALSKVQEGAVEAEGIRAAQLRQECQRALDLLKSKSIIRAIKSKRFLFDIIIKKMKELAQLKASQIVFAQFYSTNQNFLKQLSETKLKGFMKDDLLELDQAYEQAARLLYDD